MAAKKRQKRKTTYAERMNRCDVDTTPIPYMGRCEPEAAALRRIREILPEDYMYTDYADLNIHDKVIEYDHHLAYERDKRDIARYGEPNYSPGNAFNLGCADYSHRQALVFIVEAARNLCAVESETALVLLREAVREVERSMDPKTMRRLRDEQ